MKGMFLSRVGRALFGALALVLCLAWGSAAFAAMPTYEGPGFATPEEAVETYLEGLKAGDLSMMLSAYAIEKYVANYDFEGMIQWLQVFLPNQQAIFPGSGPLYEALNVETRKAEVVASIVYQQLAFVLPEFAPGQPTAFSGDDREGKVADFIQKFRNRTQAPSLQSLAFEQFMEPALLSNMYLAEKNQEMLAKKAALCGADEMRSLVAAFSVELGDVMEALETDVAPKDGRLQFMLCCDALRYGDRWYMGFVPGNIGNLLGVTVLTGGIGLIE